MSFHARFNATHVPHDSARAQGDCGGCDNQHSRGLQVEELWRRFRKQAQKCPRAGKNHFRQQQQQQQCEDKIYVTGFLWKAKWVFGTYMINLHVCTNSSCASRDETVSRRLGQTEVAHCTATGWCEKGCDKFFARLGGGTSVRNGLN